MRNVCLASLLTGFILLILTACQDEVEPIEVTTQKTGFIYQDDWALKDGVKFTQATSKEVADTPEEYNFLLMGKASEVKLNVQRCGDCWSQASTKNLELLIAGHENRLPQLSVQTQISKCSSHGSCGGGYMSAPSFLVKHGNPFESQDPYKAKNTSCKFSKSELETGFENTLVSAPYVGTSLEHSRYYHSKGLRSGAKVTQIKALMYKHKSPAVTTIKAVSHTGGIVKSCASINSGGNHMQNIVGWYQHEGDEVATLFNSWGKSHGQNGITHIKWECGKGRLNRGVGNSTRIYINEACKNPADAYTGSPQNVIIGNSVMLGKANPNQKCEWFPKNGLTHPLKCETLATPAVSTEYHVRAITECGEQTAMTVVTVLSPELEKTSALLTPHGVIN